MGPLGPCRHVPARLMLENEPNSSPVIHRINPSGRKWHYDHFI